MRLPCVWYRLESSDAEWLTFLSYLVATMRQVDPGFGRQTEALLRHVAAMGSSREMVCRQFLAELGSLGDGPWSSWMTSTSRASQKTYD